jgi:HlyD family secretion protein
LLDGTTREELAQAEAQLSEADARVELARIVVRRMDIVAPRAGRIDALPYKLGERPPAGATVIVMLADQAPFARIYVPEPMRARVHPGLAARVNVDGVAGSFEGTVRYVSADATFTPYFALTQRDRSRLAFLAEVTLTQDAARELPSGVPVQVDFPGLQ